MSLKEKILHKKGPIILEVSPPRGLELEQILESLTPLIPFLDAFSVTDNPRGRARMSALAFAHILAERTSKEVVLHITCRDRNILALQADLLGAYALGIKNFLLLTGDPPSSGDYPSAKAVFDVTSEGLVSIANRLRRGVDLSGRDIGEKPDFLIGVAVDPFSQDRRREIERLKRKISLGADYAISQPVFSLSPWQEFLEEIPSDFPVIGGIWIMKSKRMAHFLQNEVPGISIPVEVMRRMEESENEREEGVKIGTEISKALLKEGHGIALMVGNDFSLAQGVLERLLS